MVRHSQVLRKQSRNLQATMHLLGKLGSRREQLNALGGLTFLTDSLSGLTFLVDTGAAVSVLPHSSSPSTAHGPALAGADGKGIHSWGKVLKSVCFNGRHFLDVPFILAAVANPILGADFFSTHHLLVDTSTHSVLDAVTLLPIGGTQEPESGSGKKSRLVAHLSTISPPVRKLLAEFPGVVGNGDTTPRPLHGVEHSIETKGRPLFAKSRRLDPEKLRIAEKEFQALEKMCIVRRSNSGWSSPLHMVPKPDGSFRPCGDYRRLNTVTEDDRYPLPSILDFSSNLAGCTVFSKVDLVKGYHQVPMAKADIPKTAICTPFGLFEYLFMPFGLKNAAQTFQRLMDRLFRHLPFVFVYLDDILIASRSDSEHLDHLRQVFAILQDNGLQLNPAKCVFAAVSLSFLGHRVDAHGIAPLPKHVQALLDFPPPCDLKQLQRYLGMINFYRRFLPGIAGVLQPLTDLLRGNPKTLVWTDTAAAAFTAGKAALAKCTVLAHPSPGSTISLAVDASDSHVGAVLQQLTNSGSWSPLAFFSRKLSYAEVKYSTFDRELLAAFSAVRHFRFVLEGRKFRLLTDHMPLTHAMNRVSPLWSARQVRQMAYISEFTTDLRHVPGSKNVVADALSRPSTSPPPPPPRTPPPLTLPPPSTPPAPLTPPPPPKFRQATVQKSTLKNNPPTAHTAASPLLPPTPSQATVQKSTIKNNPPQLLLAALPSSSPIDYDQMAALQSSCTECTQMCNSTVLFVVTRKIGEALLRGDISQNVFRPLVPVSMRSAVIAAIHNIAHPGVEATVRLVSGKFCWPKMAKQIRLFTQQCISCQKQKFPLTYI